MSPALWVGDFVCAIHFTEILRPNRHFAKATGNIEHISWLRDARLAADEIARGLDKTRNNGPCFVVMVNHEVRLKV